MELDRDDRSILEGEYGETRQKMMEMLVALGKVFGARRLIPIKSAQVSGVSYKTIGPWGLRWLESLHARVAVPTVANPIGMPREGWEELGITPEFAKRQLAVMEAYRNLGVKLECTCTPYYLHMTSYGDHLAWAESSAVVFANSVIGARTNREGGPGALAAAIIGKTPEYGYHLLTQRKPQVAIRLDGGEEEWPDDVYGALGYLAGRQVGNRIPLFTGIRPKRDDLKALGAAMAATGAVSLFHVQGLTPEARIFHFEARDLETITIERAAVRDLFADFDVDAVAIGCPHCSGEELDEIARMLEGKTVRVPLLVFAARQVILSRPDAVSAITRAGGRVIGDTCMVVSPMTERFRALLVDSGKALAYVPDMCGVLARIATREECIRVAVSGR